MEVTIRKLESEVESLKIHLETANELSVDYQAQVKLSQERMEEMNRGRRIVEEHNTHLEAKITERESQLEDMKSY